MQVKPQHIAIIMDGNGRWAKKRFLPRFAGHKAGVKAVKRVLKYCSEQDISTLTLFAFSSENWLRPKTEISELMNLFLNLLEKDILKLNENGIRLQVIGDISKFSDALQAAIFRAQDLTKNNSKLKLNIAANYGGRWDIVSAAKQLTQEVLDGNLSIAEIDDAQFEKHLSTNNISDPDLLIRTSGEQRISNFLLWQLSYTELYFCETLWPDFDEKHMQAAVDSFMQRERRFGLTDEQKKQA